MSKFHFSKSKNYGAGSQSGHTTPSKPRLAEEVLPDQYADVLYKNDVEQVRTTHALLALGNAAF